MCHNEAFRNLNNATSMRMTAVASQTIEYHSSSSQLQQPAQAFEERYGGMHFHMQAAITVMAGFRSSVVLT